MGWLRICDNCKQEFEIEHDEEERKFYKLQKLKLKTVDLCHKCYEERVLKAIQMLSEEQ